MCLNKTWADIMSRIGERSSHGLDSEGSTKGIWNRSLKSRRQICKEIRRKDQIRKKQKGSCCDQHSLGTKLSQRGHNAVSKRAQRCLKEGTTPSERGHKSLSKWTQSCIKEGTELYQRGHRAVSKTAQSCIKEGTKAVSKRAQKLYQRGHKSCL